MSMTDPAILDTDAYKLIQNRFLKSIDEGPTYICDICWKFEYRTNVIKLNPDKYNSEIFLSVQQGNPVIFANHVTNYFPMMICQLRH